MNSNVPELQLGRVCAGGLITYTTTHVARFPAILWGNGQAGPGKGESSICRGQLDRVGVSPARSFAFSDLNLGGMSMTDDTRHTSTLREAAHMPLRPGGGNKPSRGRHICRRTVTAHPADKNK